ncbi:MAG: hypothetical protein ABEJ93_01050 [Candidatus Nanohalobium sp.]
MRKTFVIAAALLLASTAGAVVYENGSSPSNNVKDGEMAITSTEASATTAGPNGTQYTVKLWETGQLSNITEDRLRNISTKYIQLSFTGLIDSPTPCHKLKHNITGSDDSFTLNIYLEESNQTCIQQKVMKKYRLEMENNRPFTLKVQHKGETLQKLRAGHGQIEDEKTLLDKIISFFNNLL